MLLPRVLLPRTAPLLHPRISHRYSSSGSSGGSGGGSSGRPQDEQKKQHGDHNALPAPEQEGGGGGGGGSKTVNLEAGGGEARLSTLGPLVVNADGTTGTVGNWHDMTADERETTLRLLRRRNAARLEALRKGKEGGS